MKKNTTADRSFRLHIFRASGILRKEEPVVPILADNLSVCRRNIVYGFVRGVIYIDFQGLCIFHSLTRSFPKENATKGFVFTRSLSFYLREGGKHIPDILFQTASLYNLLGTIAYDIHLGKKGCLYKLFLRFPKEAFYHLAGLQHLTDITFPSTNKERIFKDILAQKLTLKNLEKSVFYEKYFIAERIASLALLETMLDNNSVTYLLNNNSYKKYTNIRADYIFEYKEANTHTFYFFARKLPFSQIENDCIGCSFFPKHDRDYTKEASKTTTLLIHKIRHYSEPGSFRSIIYQNPAYLPDQSAFPKQ